MDVLTLVRVMRRRWRVVAPILALTAVAAVSLLTFVPSEYGASASAVLVNANAPVITAGGPTLGDAGLAATVLAERMQDGEVRQALESEGATARYQLTAEATGVVRVRAVARNSSAVVSTVNVLLDVLSSDLDRFLNDDALDEFLTEEDQRSAGLSVEVLNRPSTANVEKGIEVATGAVAVSVVTAGGNYPFTSVDTLSILAAVVGSDEVRARVDEQGLAADYEVLVDPQSPVFTVTAAGSDQIAKRTVEAVLDAAQDELAQVYADTAGPDGDMTLRLAPLTEPIPIRQSKGLTRSLAAVVAAGFLAAGGAAIVLESILAGRPRSSVASDTDDDAQQVTDFPPSSVQSPPRRLRAGYGRHPVRPRHDIGERREPGDVVRPPRMRP